MNDITSSYTTIHDYFYNNGVGEYKVQCNYNGVPYATDGCIHAGDKFYADNFMDSHYGKEIKMYPQSELLAKEYAGNVLLVSISLDKDLIKIKDCQKKAEFVGLEEKSNDLVYDKQWHIKCHTTRLSYDNVRAYDNKASTLNIRHDISSNPQYGLCIVFTRVNDNKPGFWQKFRNMF